VLAIILLLKLNDSFYTVHRVSFVLRRKVLVKRHLDAYFINITAFFIKTVSSQEGVLGSFSVLTVFLQVFWQNEIHYVTQVEITA